MTIFTARRTCLGILAASALCLAAAVHAQTYPTKLIKFIVPFPPGGATDTMARLLAEKMGPRLGQTIIVDNKGGAAGILGTDLVAKAPADGHTLTVSLSTNLLTNQFLFKKLPYDPQRDLALVSQIAVAPIVLIVHPSVSASNGPELLKYIAANKGKLSYGSWGIGSAAHLSGAHLSQAQNADMSHVAYKGEAPMITDLISGQIQMAFASALQAKPFVEAGKLKAIGVTGEKRMSVLPDLPTLIEQGLKDDVFRVTGWVAMAAPAATPKAVVQRLADEVRAACELPDVRARIIALGFDPVARGPEEFAAAYKKDLPVWEQLVKQSGATLD
jgi:tripartite-type tricarboxylate transporter receptor subunit TctC